MVIEFIEFVGFIGLKEQGVLRAIYCLLKTTQ